MSPSVSNLVIGLAVECRSQLDPAMFDRLVHNGWELRWRSNAEGMDIARQLEDLKKRTRQ